MRRTVLARGRFWTVLDFKSTAIWFDEYATNHHKHQTVIRYQPTTPSRRHRNYAVKVVILSLTCGLSQTVTHYHPIKPSRHPFGPTQITLTFPMASRPLSKRNRTPRNRKATPNPTRPMPISETRRKAVSTIGNGTHTHRATRHCIKT